jgi:DNA-binding response OmpR family regulator
MVTGWKDLRVLVVDDDEDLLDSVYDALLLFGCRAARAMSLAEARASVARERPEVIICDWNLDGKHSDRFLREMAAVGNVALILLTGSGRDEWQPLVAEGVVQLAIVKPFDLHALAAAATRLRDGDGCGAGRTCRCVG